MISVQAQPTGEHPPMSLEVQCPYCNYRDWAGKPIPFNGVGIAQCYSCNKHFAFGVATTVTVTALKIEGEE